MKKYLVEPDGIIKGGWLGYWLEPLTGRLSFHGEIKLKIFFFTQTRNFTGSYIVDPVMFSPQGFKELGKQLRMGEVEFKVIEATSDESHIEMQVPGKNFSARAIVLTGNREVVELHRASAEARVLGMNLNLRLKAE